MLVSLFRGRGARADDGGSSDRSVFGNFWFEPVGLRTLSGARVTPNSAMALPIIWACVGKLSKSFAVMPFDLFEPLEPRGRKRRRDHWLYRLIAKSPNPWQSPFDFKVMLMGHLALRGNAFCQITSNARGEITELLPLHPDRMTIEVMPGGAWRYRYTDQDNKPIYYTRGDVWHLKWMSDDGIVGRSPIEIAREAIGEGLAMQSYSSRFFANDTRPGGWIEYPGKFSDESAKETFKQSWQKAYGGPNLRKVAVLERGMKYHQLALNNADAQFVEARAAKAAELPRIWDIPPHKVGVLDKATNNNIEHQSIEFWTDCIWPWAKMWADSMDAFLLGADSGLDAEFDIKPMMRGDGTSRATRIRSLVLAGVMMRNEGREEEGYDPLEGLDTPLAPLNMGTVEPDGSIEAPEAADPEAQPGAAPDDGSGERLEMLLRTDAGRMARRLAKGERMKAETLAEALAIPTASASSWIDAYNAASEEWDEDRIEDSLFALALGNPAPRFGVVTIARSSTDRIGTAAASVQPPVVHNNVRVDAPITVPAPILNATVEGPVINLPATQVVNEVSVPTPVVNVSVDAPVVHNHVTADVAAPVVHNHVEPAQVQVIKAEDTPKPEQPRPWPTRTEILKRDAQGRADIFETRPLDE